MDSTIMRSLIVDNVAFDDTLWQEMSMSSDSSFVKYSMDLGGGDTSDSECPCISPPPDFDIRPPPKPFTSADDDSWNDLRVDDSCPVDFPGFISNTIVPKDGTSVNEPLIFIITAASVMAMALIVFTIVMIWCQKKGWCKSWTNKNSKLSATFSSETEESTAGYSTGVCHKTEWSFNSMKGDKKFAQVPNLGVLMYSGTVQDAKNGHILQHSQNRPLPTLPKLQHMTTNCVVTNSLNRRNCEDGQSTRTYDSHNPVYEEISLNGIPMVDDANDERYFVCEKCPVGTTNLLNQPTVCDSLSQSEGSSNSDGDSPCSCQSCGKSTSIGNNDLSPTPKRNNKLISKINQSTQSEETFLQDDCYCECTNNGRESGYGTEGYPARDFGTWDSPKRVSPPIVAKRINNKNNQNLLHSASLTKRPQNVWVTAEEKSKRTAAGPFAVFSSDNLGSSSAYV